MEPQRLAAYKATLFHLRSRLVREVGLAEEALRDDASPPGEVSTVPTHPADAAVEGVDEQILIAQNEEQLLAQVEAALERIEAGIYGTCQNCNRAIAKERLDALPYTASCIQCARQHAGET
jgi:DnaK suppressor protein